MNSKENGATSTIQNQFKILNFSEEWLQKKANEVGDEITSLLKHEKSRKNSSLQNDYKECAELTLAIIGYVHREDVSHHRPGATHSACYMSQVLYSQKIYLWADQMNYDNETVSKLHWSVTFLVLFYVPTWLKCNIGADAAINDFNFLQSMLEYKPYDASVSTAAFQKLHKHNRYLTEENVLFSLCSQNIAISKESRQQMADRLLLIPRPDEFRRGIAVLRQPVDQNTHLIDLVGPESLFMFGALGLKHDWLRKHVTEWDMSTSYQEMKSFVNSVKVVNDAAEGGVKLNTDYAAILTDDPQESERILQAVEDDRE